MTLAARLKVRVTLAARLKVQEVPHVLLAGGRRLLPVGLRVVVEVARVAVVGDFGYDRRLKGVVTGLVTGIELRNGDYTRSTNAEWHSLVGSL